MKRYVLSAEAEKDLDSIKSYLLRQAGLQVTRYVLRELRSAMRFLAKTPRAGHNRKDLTEEPVLFWAVFSYLIVYDPERRPMEIVRVLHGKRDLTAILDPKTGR